MSKMSKMSKNIAVKIVIKDTYLEMDYGNTNKNVKQKKTLTVKQKKSKKTK